MRTLFLMFWITLCAAPPTNADECDVLVGRLVAQVPGLKVRKQRARNGRA